MIDPVAICMLINRTFGSDIRPSDLINIDGVWTIDGMLPMEWAQAIFGEDDES